MGNRIGQPKKKQKSTKNGVKSFLLLPIRLNVEVYDFARSKDTYRVSRGRGSCDLCDIIGVGIYHNIHNNVISAGPKICLFLRSVVVDGLG